MLFFKILFFIGLTVFVFCPASSNDEGLGNVEREGSSISDEQRSPAEKNTAFEQKIQKYFASVSPGGYFVFAPDKAASQTFKKECSNSYGYFKDQVNKFGQTKFDPTNPSSQRSKELDNKKVKKTLEECQKKITDNYNQISRDFAEQINNSYIKQKFPSSGDDFIFLHTSVTSTLQKYPQNLPRDITKIKDQIIKWSEFQISSCFSSAVYASYDRKKAYQNFQDYRKEEEWYMEELHNKGCHEKKRDFEAFTKSHIFRDFISLPGRCENPPETGCISDLKKTADLNEEESLFDVCQKAKEQAYDCCFSTSQDSKETEAQKILQLIRAENETVCSEDFARIKQSMIYCQECLKEQEKLCQTKISEFKEDFLGCFFLPGFSKNSRDLHQHTACKRQISNIEGSFTTGAKQPPFNFRAGENPQLAKLKYNREDFMSRRITKDFDKVIADLETKWNKMACNKKDPHQNQQEPLNAQAVSSSPTTSSTGGPAHSARGPAGGVIKGPGNANSLNSYNWGDPFQKNDSSSKPPQPSQVFDYQKSLSKKPKSNFNPQFPFQDKEGYKRAKEKKDTFPSPRFSGDIGLNKGLKPFAETQEGLMLDIEELSQGAERDKNASFVSRSLKAIKDFTSVYEPYGLVTDEQLRRSNGVFNQMKRKIKEGTRAFKDKIFSLSPGEFQKRYSLDNESVDLMEVQRRLFKEFCQRNDCGDLQPFPLYPEKQVGDTAQKREPALSQ